MYYKKKTYTKLNFLKYFYNNLVLQKKIFLIKWRVLFDLKVSDLHMDMLQKNIIVKILYLFLIACFHVY